MCRTQVICQALPGPIAKRLGHFDRVDAQQRNSAQDKGHDGAFQFDSAGHTDGCDVAPRPYRTGQPAQSVTTHIINGATPQGFLQRPRAHFQLMTVNKLGGPKLSQVIVLIRLASQRNHLKAFCRQHVNSNTADAAGSTGHNHRTVIGALAVFLKPDHGNGGSKARGTDCHYLPQFKILRNRHHALGRDPGYLGITAVAGFRKAATAHQNAIAGFIALILAAFHCSGEVNAAIEIGDPQYLALAGRSQCILEVDSGVGNTDNNIALSEITDLHLFKPRADTLFLLVYSESPERHRLKSPFGRRHRYLPMTPEQRRRDFNA